MDEITTLEWRLHPGMTLRVSQSKVVVRFKIRKRTLKGYFNATLKKLQVHPLHLHTINAGDQGVPAPVWLLCELASCLAEHAATGAKPTDDAPAS